MYKTVLTALDLSQRSSLVIAKAQKVIEGTDADLHLVHVVEPVSLSYGDALVVDFSSVQDQIFHQAEDRLKALATEAGIPLDHCHTLSGRTEPALCECVEMVGAGLLVLGGQTSSGLRTIFGSTSAGMLRGIPCDLLFIRLDT